MTIGPSLLKDNLAYFDALEERCLRALAQGVPVDLPAEADVAAMVDFPFDKAVQAGEYADFLNDHHRTAWHPQQIRMMLAHLGQAG